MLKWLFAVLLVAATPAVAQDVAQDVLAEVNAARAQAGCGALVLNPALTAAAHGHAAAMAEKNFFGHASKNGGKFSGRIKAQGYRFHLAAENIAAGQSSVAEVVQTWLQSPGHRENILNCALRETGIAMTYQPDDAPIAGQAYPLKYYWVQVFATP
jgi:uncharacterized protein YkwD